MSTYTQERLGISSRRGELGGERFLIVTRVAGRHSCRKYSLLLVATASAPIPLEEAARRIPGRSGSFLSMRPVYATRRTTGLEPRAMTTSSPLHAFSISRESWVWVLALWMVTVSMSLIYLTYPHRAGVNLRRSHNSRVRLQHLLCVLAGSICQFRAAQHAGNLFSAFFADEGTDGGAGASADLLLFNYMMAVSKGRNLRQVGHTEDLIGSRELFEFFAYGLGGAAANANINFVEDHGPLRAGGFLLRRPGLHAGFQRQHYAGKLTAGRDLLQSPQRLARIS